MLRLFDLFFTAKVSRWPSFENNLSYWPWILWHPPTLGTAFSKSYPQWWVSRPGNSTVHSSQQHAGPHVRWCMAGLYLPPSLAGSSLPLTPILAVVGCSRWVLIFFQALAHTHPTFMVKYPPPPTPPGSGVANESEYFGRGWAPVDKIISSGNINSLLC